MSDLIFRALDILKSQGVIIYPTETFWGLGGLGSSPEVVQRIRVLKKRPMHKPFPLIAGSLDQALDFVFLDRPDMELARNFWPGSLSILARASELLAPGVRNGLGLVSIRVPPHAEAAGLCLAAGAPIIATSANVSGQSPCARREDLDAELVQNVELVLELDQGPAGILPSTLVRSSGFGRVHVLREGMVSREELEAGGWKTV